MLDLCINETVLFIHALAGAPKNLYLFCNAVVLDNFILHLGTMCQRLW